MKKKLLLTAITALAFLGFLGNAGAATITDTDQFDWKTTELHPINNPAVLSVDMFDTLGGTRILTGVEINFTGWLQSSGTLTNTSGTTQSFTAIVEAYSFFADPSLAIINNFQLFPIPATITSTSVVNLVTGATATMPYGIITRSQSQSFNSGLSNFYGPGFVTFDLSTLIAQTAVGAGGNITWAVNTDAKANVEIIYTYETSEVPEPAALLLFGMGMLGFSGILRKKTA